MSWWAEWRINPQRGEGATTRARVGAKRSRRGIRGRQGAGGGGRRQCGDILLTVDGGSKMSARCLFFLDGGKREENPMSHTPLHRATVLLLNTTPRGALRPPSSPSATKNKLARFTVRSSGCPRARARERSPSPTLSPFLSHSHSPPFFLSHTLSLTLSLSRSLARSRSRFTSCNAADTFIRAFGPFSDTLAHLSRSTTDRPTNRPTDRPTVRFSRNEEVAVSPLTAACRRCHRRRYHRRRRCHLHRRVLDDDD